MPRPRKNAEVVTTTENSAEETKRRGRPAKNPLGPNEKVSDRVKGQVKAKKTELGRQLTIEETAEACLTAEDMIDEHGVFMGEDYEKIISKPHSEEELDRISKLYQYDPVKERHNVRIIFCYNLLAVSPGDPEMKASHVLKNSMDALSRDEEIMIAGAQAVIDKGREHFEVINGKMVWSVHRWLAFIREKAADLAAISGTMTSEASNLKSNILKRISFSRKYYPITLPKDERLTHLDRSMPAGYNRDTSIKSSEMAPVGTSTYFVVQIENTAVSGKEKDKKVSTWDVIRECLNSGFTRGTGGWRGSGLYGNFLWEELDDNGIVIDGNTYYHIGYTTNEPEFKDAFLKFANNLICCDTDEPEVPEFSL